MTLFFGYLFSGLVAGAVYALMASGLVLSFAASGVLNFAQGAISFVTAIVFYELNSGLHWPVVPSALVAIGVVAPGLGWLLNRVMFDRLAHSGETAQIVATIGLLVALPSLALWIVDIMINTFHWDLASPINQASAPGLGPTPAKYFNPFPGVALNTNQIATFAAAAVVAVGLWLMLTRSRLGLKMRATSDRREMAQLRGINTGRASASAWIISSTLAGLAGVLAAPLIGLNANAFTLLLLLAATAAVYGAFRSIPITFVAGLLLGVVQNLVAGYATFADNIVGFSTAVPVVLLLVGLVIFNRNKARIAGSASDDVPPPDFLADQPRWRRIAPWAVSFAVVLVFVFFIGNEFWNGVVAQGLALSVVFLSFVIVTGIGGMVSFAQATFVTAAALTAGLLFTKGAPFALAALAGILVAVVVGVVVALPALRLGGRILALSTLSIALLGDYMLFQLNTVANSGLGWTFPKLAIGLWDTSNPKAMVVLLLAVNGVIAVLIANLVRSPSGRAMLAVRSAPAAASTSGISITRTKLSIFALSAAVAGFGGILYAIFNGRFGTSDAPALTGFIWLAVVVVQGVRRPAGAIVAGLFATVGPQLFNYINPAGYLPNILFGLGGIVLAQQPDGALSQMAEKRYLRRLRKRAAAEIAAADAEVHAGNGPTVEQPQADLAPPQPVNPPIMMASGQPSGGLLELDDVSAGYGAITAIRGIDLSVAPGTVVALLGANGAGKTTLCKVITGQVLARSGAMRFKGEDIVRLNADVLARRGILSMPEARGIFPSLTVEENLATWLSSKTDRQKAFDRFPVLGERRKLPAASLSGGEQQMLSLAPLMVRPPFLAVADEPSLGLAPLITRQIFELFGELSKEGVTIILSEEKPTEALKIADRAVFMRVGRIVWSGRREDVNDSALLGAYLGTKSADHANEVTQ